ncbi:MAG: hypothetical protein ACLUFN_07595 [Eubacterium sp.]
MSKVKIRYDKIISGKQLELYLYPTHKNTGKRLSEGPKTDKTNEQMAAENDRKAAKKFVRICAANFDENDYILTCEYKPEYAPANEKECHKDIKNYMERVRYHRLKKGLSNKNFKYCFYIHCETYKSGIKKGQPHYHFHGFITADGMSTKELKRLWKFGTKGKIEHYDPESYEPDEFAYYAASGGTNTRNHIEKGSRKYVHSKNCKPPKVEPKKDAKLNKEKLESIAKNRANDKKYWEEKYPTYRYVRMDPNYNSYNGYYYVTVIMYKKTDKDSYYERSRQNAKPNLTYAKLY